MNLPLIDNCLLISASSLEKFTTCPRSYEYYAIRRRISSEPKSALEFGRVIHKALEYRYSHDGGFVTSDIEAGQIRVCEEGYKDLQVPDGDFRTYERAVAMVRAYNETYKVEPFEVCHLPDGKSATEVTFVLPLGTVGETKILWKGIIDLIVAMNVETWIVDHKTTSILGANFFPEFYLSAPALGYMWAGQQLLQKPIRGLLVNALANRKPTKTGISIEFARDKIFLNQDNVEEWVQNTLTICGDILRCAERSSFPQHMKWCVGKYGKCPYWDVCTLPRQDRETMLSSGNYADAVASPIGE